MGEGGGVEDGDAEDDDGEDGDAEDGDAATATAVALVDDGWRVLGALVGAGAGALDPDAAVLATGAIFALPTGSAFRPPASQTITTTTTTTINPMAARFTRAI